MPDTGTKVTFLGVGETGNDEDDTILVHYWLADGDEISNEVTVWNAKDQLREDGTYNVQFWLDEDERKYPEFYDEGHLITIVYHGSRFYLGFVVSTEESTPTPTTPPSILTAKPTASTVLVNGENVAFDAYNINDNNYFKLRDLAYILSGTEKQFEVS